MINLPYQFKVDGAIAHGTSARHLDDILRKGLRPRGKAPSVWGEAPSVRDNVYLTNAYALHFARAAVNDGEDALIVQVDPGHLKTRNLMPDEDAVAQVVKGDHTDGRFKDVTLLQATAHVRENLRAFRRDGYAGSWSMVALGTCSHEGPIPVQAITRIVRLARPSHMDVVSISDPSITITNYRWVGEYYRALQVWLMAGGEGPMPVQEMGLQSFTAEMRADWDKGMERVTDSIRSRLSVVYTREGGRV